jgi:hypothetical protein
VFTTEELQDLASLMDEDYLSRRMLGAGETLLKQYVMLQSERLGALVKKSLAVPDWLTRKEPRDARPVVDIIIGEVRLFPFNRVVNRDSWCYLLVSLPPARYTPSRGCGCPR